MSKWWYIVTHCDSKIAIEPDKSGVRGALFRKDSPG